MRKDDALSFLVELDYLEFESLTKLSLASVFLNEVLWSSKTFNTTFESDYCTLVEYFCNLTLVNSILCIYSFECIPWVVLKPLVTE